MKTFNIMKQQGIVLELVIELTKMLDREDLTDEGYKLIDELGDKIDNITDMLLDARCNNKLVFGQHQYSTYLTLIIGLRLSDIITMYVRVIMHKNLRILFFFEFYLLHTL